jgi:hypothetical protein
MDGAYCSSSHVCLSALFGWCMFCLLVAKHWLLSWCLDLYSILWMAHGTQEPLVWHWWPFFFLSSSIFVPSLINLQDDMRNMYDKVTNRYSSKINRRPITLVSLILKQTYEEQLKLKKGEIIKKESLYIKGNLFSNKILFCFDDNVIFWLGSDLLTLKDFFYNTDSRSNLFKEMEDDTNQVRSEFDLKMFANQFCKIKHISRIIHQIKPKIYRKILDTWNYIVVNFHIK